MILTFHVDSLPTLRPTTDTRGADVGGLPHPERMADIIPTGPWAGFERARAFEWSTFFYDSPPSFPGASIMALSYRAHREQGFVGLGAWAETARRAEAVGFTPTTYALLVRQLAGRETTRPIDVDRWARWPELVRSGHRPNHATALVQRNLDESLVSE